MDKPIPYCETCPFVGDNSNRCLTCIHIERSKENDFMGEIINGRHNLRGDLEYDVN